MAIFKCMPNYPNKQQRFTLRPLPTTKVYRYISPQPKITRYFNVGNTGSWCPRSSRAVPVPAKAWGGDLKYLVAFLRFSPQDVSNYAQQKPRSPNDSKQHKQLHNHQRPNPQQPGRLLLEHCRPATRRLQAIPIRPHHPAVYPATPP